jgi:hypothetical protein
VQSFAKVTSFYFLREPLENFFFEKGSFRWNTTLNKNEIFVPLDFCPQKFCRAEGVVNPALPVNPSFVPTFVLTHRVARWHIFKPKIIVLVHFWRDLQWKMLVYFMDI